MSSLLSDDDGNYGFNWFGAVGDGFVALFGCGKAVGFVSRPLADFPCRVTILLLSVGAAEIDFGYFLLTRLALHVF